jgi:hypothetical protein
MVTLEGFPGQVHDESMRCIIRKDLFTKPRLVPENGHTCCTVRLDGHLHVQTSLRVPHTASRNGSWLTATGEYPMNRALDRIVQPARGGWVFVWANTFGQGTGIGV